MSIERLRELLAKATPGPWQAKDRYLWDEIVGNVDGPDDDQYHYTEVAQAFGRADAALIVEAVTALPGLLDDYAALQARIAELEARNAASERDAGRYRWLRECSAFRSDRTMYVHRSRLIDGVYQGCDYLSREELDAAIDAHAQGQAGEEKDG